jgi:hypothetical protein
VKDEYIESLRREVERLKKENEELRLEVALLKVEAAKPTPDSIYEEIREHFRLEGEHRGREEGRREMYRFIMSDDIADNIPGEDVVMVLLRERTANKSGGKCNARTIVGVLSPSKVREFPKPEGDE